jgi:hypothetical protein
MGRYDASDSRKRAAPYGPYGEGWRTPERGYIPGADRPGEGAPRGGRPELEGREAGYPRGRGGSRRPGRGVAPGTHGERSTEARYAGDYPRLSGGRGLDQWVRDNIDEPDRYRNHPLLGPRRRSDWFGRGNERG